MRCCSCSARPLVGAAPWLVLQAIHSTMLLRANDFQLFGQQGYLDPWRSRWLDTLFSSWHGLLSWTPVVYVAVLGTVALLWRMRAVGDPQPGPARRHGLGQRLDRRLGRRLVVRRPAIHQHAGDAGARAWPWWSSRRSGARSGCSRLVVAAVVAWNYGLMVQYTAGMVPKDEPVSFGRVVRQQAELATRPPFVYPFAFPANVWFAWREGLPVDRYDLLAVEPITVDVEIVDERAGRALPARRLGRPGRRRVGLALVAERLAGGDGRAGGHRRPAAPPRSRSPRARASRSRRWKPGSSCGSTAVRSDNSSRRRPPPAPRASRCRQRRGAVAAWLQPRRDRQPRGRRRLDSTDPRPPGEIARRLDGRPWPVADLPSPHTIDRMTSSPLHTVPRDRLLAAGRGLRVQAVPPLPHPHPQGAGGDPRRRDRRGAGRRIVRPVGHPRRRRCGRGRRARCRGTRSSSAWRWAASTTCSPVRPRPSSTSRPPSAAPSTRRAPRACSTWRPGSTSPTCARWACSRRAGFRTMDALVTYIMRPRKDPHPDVRAGRHDPRRDAGRHRGDRRHHRGGAIAAIAAASTSIRTCRRPAPTPSTSNGPGRAPIGTMADTVIVAEDAAGEVIGYLAYRRREPVSSLGTPVFGGGLGAVPARQSRRLHRADPGRLDARTRRRGGQRVPDAELQLRGHPRLRGGRVPLRPRRIHPARVARLTGARRAAVLEFARLSRRADNAPGRHGRLAQLGERRVRNAEVGSSSLLPSTTTSPAPPRILGS